MKKIFTLVSALIIGLTGFSQTFINEDFSTFTMPVQPPMGSGWKNVDSLNTPPSDSIWRFDNPNPRALAAPFSGNAAIVDSDYYGTAATQDCYLNTPDFDASLATVVRLEFDHVYRHFAGSVTSTAEVEVFDGVNWILDTIYSMDTDPTGNDIPTRAILDISQYAAGVSNAQVRFRYTGNWGWYWMIDNVTIYQPTPDDASVISVDSTVAGCGLDSTTIVATVVNAGSTSINNFPIGYTLNGMNPIFETVNASLNPGDTIQYSFLTKANMSTVGSYDINVFTTLRGDVNPANDTATGTTIHKQTISTFPYTEGFENGNGGWVSEGINSTWALGAPTGTVINSAANGVNSYVTNLSGNYNDGEESFVLGPCFDFTGLNAPQFKMNVWWNSEFSWDGAVLQMSIDDGLTWNKVGDFGDPNNWYTDDDVNGLVNIEPSLEGWTGRVSSSNGSGGWVLAEHDLTGAANQPSVQLRVAFGSDGFVNDEGFAFDDIIIQEAPASDAGIVSIVSPVTNCGLGAADSVCIQIANFGAATLSNFPVRYEFNGNLITDTVTATLNPGDTMVFCFDTTINVSMIGTYSILTYTDVPTDGNLLNDTANNIFDNIPIVSGYPYTEGFENGNGGWVSGGVNNSWAIGVPTGTVINVAANGANSYVTNLSGNYNNQEESFVQGPCFDFTTLNKPQIKMNVWWNSEFSWDGTVLQSSIDGGASWQKVGDFGDPDNWYTDDAIDGLTNLEPSQEGWTGRNSSSNGSGGWLLAEHDLPGLENQPAVILRIAFGSDASITDEGFAFDDVLIEEAPPIDAAAFEISSPSNDCGLTANEQVELRIINQGSDTLLSIPVVYELNGVIVRDTFMGTLLPNDTTNFVFNTTVDLSMPGDYSFLSYTDATGDGNNRNDTTRKVVTSIPTITSLPYYEGFEFGTGGWTDNGINSSWENGLPNALTINSAGGGAASYVTNLNGDYNIDEASNLESPCFDLSSLTTDPILRFRTTFEFGFNGEAWFEQSIDGGATWTKVLDNGGAINWYNNTFDQEWDNTSSSGPGVWVLVENPLVGVAGQSQVKFRFVMDGDPFSFGEGIGIDDIFIDLPSAVDAGVFSLVEPVSSCGFSASDSVKVRVINYGTDTLTTTPISYEVNGSAAVTETSTATILPGDTLDFTFNATVNLSSSGAYVFKVYTGVMGDGNPTNDTIVVTVENTIKVGSYFENFDGSSFTSGNGFNNNGNALGLGWTAVPEVPAFAWGARSFATGSNGTGPDGDHTTNATGGNFVYVEGSNGASGDTAMLMSPCLDISAMVNPRLSFWYHKFGDSTDMVDLYVDINDGTNWINGVDTIVGRVQTANADTFLLRDTTSLNAYKLGGPIQVRFRTSPKTAGPNSFATDVAIDDFNIYEGPVSVNNLGNSETVNFSIYPNPSEGQFTLVTPVTSESLIIEILDTKGQLIYNAVTTANRNGRNTIDLSNKAKGVYFVKISDSKSSKVEKLIIK